jgi:hypothetical protein
MISNHLIKLRNVFNMVKNPLHWKEPINIKLNMYDLNKQSISIENIREAIEFYTGSIPNIIIDSNNTKKTEVIVKANGYRLTYGNI